MYNIFGGQPFNQAVAGNWFVSVLVYDAMTALLIGKVKDFNAGVLTPQPQRVGDIIVSSFVRRPRSITPNASDRATAGEVGANTYGFSVFDRAQTLWDDASNRPGEELNTRFGPLFRRLNTALLQHGLLSSGNPGLLLGRSVPSQFGDARIGGYLVELENGQPLPKDPLVFLDGYLGGQSLYAARLGQDGEFSLILNR